MVSSLSLTVTEVNITILPSPSIGYIAMPADRYPEVFGDSRFLISYPFFLPGLVGMLVTMTPIPVIWFHLPETNTM